MPVFLDDALAGVRNFWIPDRRERDALAGI